jgi:hypothetical protein
MKQLNSNIALAVLYLVGGSIILLLLSFLYRKLLGIHQTLSVVLTHVDSSRNLKKCTFMLNSLLMSLFLILSALAFPFVIFLLNLSIWANIVPFILLGASSYHIRRANLLIDRDSTTGLSIISAIKSRLL